MIKEITKSFVSILFRIVLWLMLFRIFAQNSYAAENEIILPITQDTYTEFSYPSSSPWDNRNLFLGYDQSYGKGFTWIYMKYSELSLTNLGLLANDIIKADLRLIQYEGNTNNSMQIVVSKPSIAWEESTLSWDSRPSTLYSLATNNIEPNHTTHLIEITELLKRDSYFNQYDKGLMLRPTVNQQPAKTFWSTSCSVAPFEPRCNQGEEPQIILKYKINNRPTKSNLKLPLNETFTNNMEIHIEWEESTDLDGERVNYILQLSKDSEFETLVTEKNLSDTYFTFNADNDGIYYWRVKSCDEHPDFNACTYSDSAYFVIDTKEPQPPLISSLPPIWFNSEVEVELQPDLQEIYETTQIIELSTDIEFPIEKTKVIEGELIFSLNELQSQTYYLRAKSWDKAGNISGWSEIREVIIDLREPEVKSFSLDNKYISPANGDGLLDEVTLLFKITDQTLTGWEIKLFHGSGKLVKIYTSDQYQSPLKITPERELSEGNYFLILKAWDRAEKISFAPILQFTIDNTPPLTPQINGINSNLTNIRATKLTVICELNSKSKISLNDVITNSPNESVQISAQYKEGKNQIAASCTDQAANTSTSSREVILDTIPPTPPKLSLKLNKTSSNIQLTIETLENGKLEIFENSQSKQNQFIGKGPNIFTITNKWVIGQKYSYTAELTDNAGNQSLLSNVTETIWPAPPKEDLGLGIGGMLESSYQYPTTPKQSNCTIYYNTDLKAIRLLQCSFSPPSINHIFHTKNFSYEYYMTTFGSLNREIKISKKLYNCGKGFLQRLFRNLYCKDTFEKQQNETIKTSGAINTKINDINYSAYITNEYGNNKQNFGTLIWSHLDNRGRKLSVRQELSLRTNLAGKWVNITSASPFSNTLKIPIPLDRTIKNEKYFRFPFDKTVGVTQWHGNTYYNANHTGIDFGVVREKVYAPADGYIRFVGWDSYLEPCFSGGNTVRIEHDNGMHTVYMHLENFRKADGTNWSINQKIHRGDLLGLSGNTGAYDCKPLGYHLHFELRQTPLQSSHLNPVSYIEYNWNSVVTINHKAYPGRLSGDNPHPTF